MRSPSDPVLRGCVYHPLTVDFQLGKIEDDARRGDLVECLAYEALLERGLG